jgi:hypothetical protein
VGVQTPNDVGMVTGQETWIGSSRPNICVPPWNHGRLSGCVGAASVGFAIGDIGTSSFEASNKCIAKQQSKNKAR